MIATAAPRSAEGRPEVVEGRRTFIRLGLAMLLILAGFAGSLWAWTDSLDQKQVDDLPRLEVPPVAKLDVQVARRELESSGFAVEFQFQPNEIVKKGTVISQRPLAGSKVEQGELVTLLASDGPLGLSVPGVGGQQAVDAQATLAALGVEVKVVLFPSETVRAGEVIATDPVAGTRIQPRSPVRLIVSTGPALRTVPAMLGKPLELALVELGRSGLGIGRIRRIYDAAIKPGTVFEVEPAEGTQLPRETPVDIRVAGPEPTVSVPYLVGLQQGSATQVASAAGLTVTVRTSPVPAGDPLAGRVISQGTPPQSEVLANANVEITVAVPTSPVATTAPTTTAKPGG